MKHLRKISIDKANGDKDLFLDIIFAGGGLWVALMGALTVLGAFGVTFSAKTAR